MVVWERKSARKVLHFVEVAVGQARRKGRGRVVLAVEHRVRVLATLESLCVVRGVRVLGVGDEHGGVKRECGGWDASRGGLVRATRGGGAQRA